MGEAFARIGEIKVISVFGLCKRFQNFLQFYLHNFSYLFSSFWKGTLLDVGLKIPSFCFNKRTSTSTEWASIAWRISCLRLAWLEDKQVMVRKGTCL